MVLRTLSAAGAAALAVCSGAVAATAPQLRLVTSAPPTFRGSGFRPHETVRVTLQMGGVTRSVRLIAGSRGSFTVAFARVRLDYCALPLAVDAFGNRTGMVAARLPNRDCAAP